MYIRQCFLNECKKKRVVKVCIKMQQFMVSLFKNIILFFTQSAYITTHNCHALVIYLLTSLSRR